MGSYCKYCSATFFLLNTSDRYQTAVHYRVLQMFFTITHTHTLAHTYRAHIGISTVYQSILRVGPFLPFKVKGPFSSFLFKEVSRTAT